MPQTKKHDKLIYDLESEKYNYLNITYTVINLP